MKYMEYRKEHGIDDIISSYNFTYGPALAPHYPRGYCGVTKTGQPIYIERSGLINVDKVMEIITQEEMMKGYYQSYEVLQKKIFYSCSYIRQEQIMHIFNVVDLTNFSVSMLVGKVKGMAKQAADIAQDYYPE